MPYITNLLEVSEAPNKPVHVMDVLARLGNKVSTQW